MRKGTEAVEGEVEMDASGEGFVNMGTVKVNSEIILTALLQHIINAILLFSGLLTACVSLRRAR